MEKEKPWILKKELSDTAPDLNQASKDNPYKVPAGYFENLPGKVQDLKNRRREKIAKSIFNYYPGKVYAYAATIAVLVVFSLSLLFLLPGDDHDMFTGIDDEMLYESYFAYLADYDEISYYELLMAEEDIYLGLEDGLLYEYSEMEEDVYFEYLMNYMNVYHYAPADLLSEQFLY